jgi:hypothetical protein
MQTKKLSIAVAMMSLMVLLVPLAFATTNDGVCITKEITCGGSTTVTQDQYNYWWVTITLTNGNSFDITNVVVSDRFGGEFGVTIQSGPSQGDVAFSYSGATEKVSMLWTIGTLTAGSTATLTLYVYTDTNPAGRQEFTSC